jgi:hypothetical protein
LIPKVAHGGPAAKCEIHRGFKEVFPFLFNELLEEEKNSVIDPYRKTDRPMRYRPHLSRHGEPLNLAQPMPNDEELRKRGLIRR